MSFGDFRYGTWKIPRIFRLGNVPINTRLLQAYAAAVNGGLQLVLTGRGASALAEDYARMIDDGFLLEDAEPFDELVAHCADVTARASAEGKEALG